VIANNIGLQKSISNDTILPAITITSPASGLTNNKTPLLNYTVSEGTVDIKVDSSAVSKVSGNNLDPLVDGSHSVWVQSTDSAGNTGHASVNFTIDTMPPITTVSPAEGFYNAIQILH
jgi:hypothetical protein